MEPFINTIKKILSDVKDSTNEFSKQEKEEGKLKALLSYILPPIPYLDETSNKYIKYHARQGMDLFLTIIVYYIISSILPKWLRIPFSLIGFMLFTIFLIGIVNVINNKAKELPIINKIKIFK